jgi:hypothetical protein
MIQNFFTLFDSIFGLINQAIALVIGFAVIGFLWGIVKLLFAGDNQIAKKEAKSFMLYGVLTLFVMTTVWGLVNLLSETITPKTPYEGDINTNFPDAA